jgi:hypothetical protein
MKLPRRNFLHLAAGAAALPALSSFAWAQAYPSRPVRIIVPTTPAGAGDILACLMGQWLSERLGQKFIIDNRPGAGRTDTKMTHPVHRRSARRGIPLGQLSREGSGALIGAKAGSRVVRQHYRFPENLGRITADCAPGRRVNRKRPALRAWVPTGTTAHGVGFKIGLGGTIPTPPCLSTQPRWFRRGFFCTEKGALNSSSRSPQSSRFQEPEVLLRSLGLFPGLGPAMTGGNDGAAN